MDYGAELLAITAALTLPPTLLEDFIKETILRLRGARGADPDAKKNALLRFWKNQKAPYVLPLSLLTAVQEKSSVEKYFKTVMESKGDMTKIKEIIEELNWTGIPEKRMEGWGTAGLMVWGLGIHQVNCLELL